MSASAYLKALTIGASAGLRSATAPAATMLARDNALAGLVTLAAGGELIADKLPAIPARTTLAPLLARAILGGWCGAVVAGRASGSRRTGALIGAAAAIGATFGGYRLRRYLASERHIPDAFLAIVEDALAVWTARVANAA